MLRILARRSHNEAINIGGVKVYHVFLEAFQKVVLRKARITKPNFL